MEFLLILLMLSPLLTMAWTPSLNLPNGGRSAAGGGSPAFLLSGGRTNRETEEFSVLQESTVLFHLYDNILEEPWSGALPFDRVDELDIISNSPSVYNYWDASPCYGDECEQCEIPAEFKNQPMLIDILEFLGIQRVKPLLKD